MSEVGKLVQSIVQNFNKEFGPGASCTLDSSEQVEVSGWISTGCSLLDAAIGKPGIPLGRITSVSGKPSVGKTTVVNHLLAQAQVIGGVAVLFDTEFSYDVDRARRIGVQSDLIVSQPGTIEACFQRAISLINYVRSAKVNVPILIAWDTVSATPTEAEVKGGDDLAKLGKSMGDPYPMGSHAKAISAGLRKLVSVLSKQRVAIVLVNQFKEDIGAWSYGDTHLGWRPIRFHSSLCLDVSLGGPRVEEGGRPVGITTKVRVAKNKVAPPFREAVFPIMFEDGIDEVGSILDAAIEAKIVTVKGGGYLDWEKKTFRRKEWKGICTDDVYQRMRKLVFNR